MSLPRAAMRTARALVLGGVVLASTGCAGLFAGYDVAPNGLSRNDDALRRLLVVGQAKEAYARVLPDGKAAPGDELLRALYAGIIAHHAGAYAESHSALQLASELADDRYTKRISRETVAFLASDRVRPYEPSRSERLLIPYYGALNFLKQGDAAAAAVEARRLGLLLEEAQEDDGADRALLAFLREFSGAVFEAAGEWNDAEVAYRNAAALRGEGVDVVASPLPDSLGEIVVVVEQGFVAHRVEQSITIPLYRIEADRISGGDVSSRLAAAGLVAARTMAAALHASSGGVVHGTPRSVFVPLPPFRDVAGELAEECHSWRRQDDEARERCARLSDTSYLMRIAWPVHRRDGSRIRKSWRAAVGETDVPLTTRADVSDAVVADFERERTELLVRTIARAATKLAVTRTLEREASEKNEGLGSLVSALANLGTAILEQADTRSWQLLPDRIAIGRLRLPPGTHTLVLTSGDGADARTVELGPVEVLPGRLTILSTRIWD